MPKRESLPDPFTREWVQYKIEREMNIRMMFEGDGNPKEEVERGWIVDGLVRRGHLALLAGRPKEGKTNLVATLAHAVSQGIPFAGMDTQKCQVLYFAAEESEEEWDHAIRPFLPKEQSGLGVAHAANFRIDHQPDLEGLSRCIDRYKAGLIVVDPLLAAIDGGCGTSERARPRPDRPEAHLHAEGRRRHRGPPRPRTPWPRPLRRREPAARRHRQPEHRPQPPSPLRRPTRHPRPPGPRPPVQPNDQAGQPRTVFVRASPPLVAPGRFSRRRTSHNGR